MVVNGEEKQDSVVFVDIGARDGIDERWLPFVDSISVIAFEPDPVECARLSKQTKNYDISYLPYALGKEAAETVPLYITKQPGCSSLLRPNEEITRLFDYGEQLEVINTVEVELHRMDELLDRQPDVLKIDTQGTEFEILQGAERLLSQVIAIEVEVEFVELYVGQALFSDIDSFLRKSGFFLRGLRRDYWRNSGPSRHPFGGQIIHGDALFLNASLLDTPKGHIILAAYRQYDLLTSLGALHLIPKSNWSERIFRKLLSALPLSNRDFRRMVDRFRHESATDWHDPDFF